MTYDLEKKIWTDSDFDNMGWHDNHIYKIRLTKDLEMDIDYIFKWNEPDLEGLPFTFWIAPATLVFKNVRDLSFEFDTGFEETFEIEDIERERENQWTVITRHGDIQFISDSFEQFIRQNPSFQFGQTISYTERYGYSLDRVTDQENPNLVRDDIIQKRKHDLEHYENVKKRQLKRQELAELFKLKENGKIATKTFLIKKKELNDAIYSYSYFLKGTQFQNWGSPNE